MAQSEPVAAAAPSLRRALLNGTLLVLIDAFLLNQGAIALLVGLWVLLIGLPRTLLAGKFATVRPQRLKCAAVYLVAAGLVFALNAANNRIAMSRAETLIAAVKAYHAKHRRYPESLQALVPEYIDEVPQAKYTLLSSPFRYLTSPQGPSLMYVEVPPFGRPMYSFERDAWERLD